MDEGINVNSIVDHFLPEPRVETNDKPEFVLTMGGVGSGKTTIISQQYGSGYIYIDGSVIYQELKQTYPEIAEFDQVMEAIDIIGYLIATQAMSEKRNIVMEFIGDNSEEMIQIIDTVKKTGYDVHVAHVDLDPRIAYERHVKAVKDDPNYISCYFFKDMHRDWIIRSNDKAV